MDARIPDKNTNETPARSRLLKNLNLKQVSHMDPALAEILDLNTARLKRNDPDLTELYLVGLGVPELISLGQAVSASSTLRYF